MTDLIKVDRHGALETPQYILPVIDNDGHIRPMRTIREAVIAHAFVVCHASPTKTAEILNIGRSTLYRAMKESSRPTAHHRVGTDSSTAIAPTLGF